MPNSDPAVLPWVINFVKISEDRAMLINKDKSVTQYMYTWKFQ